MLFSAGYGVALLYFGVAEPVLHYSSPPAGAAETAPCQRKAASIRYTQGRATVERTRSGPRRSSSGAGDGDDLDDVELGGAALQLVLAPGRAALPSRPLSEV